MVWMAYCSLLARKWSLPAGSNVIVEIKRLPDRGRLFFILLTEYFDECYHSLIRKLIRKGNADGAKTFKVFCDCC